MAESQMHPRLKAVFQESLARRRARLLRERDEAIVKLEKAVSILRSCAFAADQRDRGLETYRKAIAALRALNPEVPPDKRKMSALIGELETVSDELLRAACPVRTGKRR